MSDQLALPDTALLFRSVRAARAWVEAGMPHRVAPAAGCIVMKPGDDGPPVFMFPGAAGSVLQLAPLADALAVPGPIYAIRPRGMSEHETPCRDVTEMAEHAVGVIARVRGDGPYFLVGYSAGGLVALETARRLSAAGHSVPLVVLLDTYPSRETWPLLCHLSILLRQTGRAIWTLRRLALREALGDVTRRLRSLLLYLAASGLRLVTPPPLVPEGSDAFSRRVHLASVRAGEAYRPARYAGRVVFMQPMAIANLEPRAPHTVWGQFLADLAIRRVPGSHLGMLNEGAAATAAEISRCLAQAGLH